jgi:hypothetical protein
MAKFKMSFYSKFLCVYGIIVGICWFMILPNIFKVNISIFSVYEFFLLILLGIFSIFIFIFCLLSLARYKIIINDDIIEIHTAFQKRKIDLNLFDSYKYIFLLKLPNRIKLFSMKHLHKDESIWCIFTNEKTLISIIEKKFEINRNNNYKWYYDFVNENKVKNKN